MRRIFSTFFLIVSSLFLVFSSLSYGGKGKDRSEPEGQPLSCGMKRPAKDSFAAQEAVEESKKGSGNEKKRIKIENTEKSEKRPENEDKSVKIESADLEGDQLFFSPGLNILKVLPSYIINLILEYISTDARSATSLRVSKEFRTLLQKSNEQYVNKYLLKDLPVQDRVGKTPEEIYQLHCARVKTSVIDTYEIPTTLENVYSSPYLEDDYSFISDLIDEICAFNKKVRQFLSLKGNTTALTHHFFSQDDDKNWDLLCKNIIKFFYEQPDILKLSSFTQINLKEILYFNLISIINEAYQRRIKLELGSEETKFNLESAPVVQQVIQILKEKGIENPLFFTENFLKYIIREVEKFYMPLVFETQNFFLNQELILEELNNRNNQEAIWEKYNRISESDLKAQYDFIERYAQKGIFYFVKLKIQGLEHGIFGYKKNLQEVQNFINTLIEQGNEEARSIKFYSLVGMGEHAIYDKNITQAYVLNEAWLAKGNANALFRKITGHTLGAYGYTQNLSEAFKLIEEEKTRSTDQKLISTDMVAKCEIDFYLYLHYFREELLQSPIFREQSEKLGLKEKIQDHAYIHFLIDQRIQENNEWAVKMKIKGLQDGIYGHTQNKYALFSFLEEAAELGHASAISELLISLYLGNNGYVQNFPALRRYISFWHNKGFRGASYVKALNLKFGIFDLPANPEKARKFILKHRIAF